MKNIKRIAAVSLVLVLSLCLLSGCGKKESDEKTIKVAACPTPHALVLEQISTELEKEGYSLEIVEFEDYVKPNQALTDGDVDANYFQHVPYLDQYNQENKTDIVSVCTVHYEAMGIYKGTKNALTELSSGDKIGVPNDVTNEARALQLLQANGVITLKEGAGLNATKADIVSNPYGVEIVELDPAIIPQSLPDLAVAVINANYAISAKCIDKAIVFEDKNSTAAQTYANIVACRKGDENSDKIQALKKAIQSETVQKYMKDTYGDVIQTIW